jgi:hypothetical protein
MKKNDTPTYPDIFDAIKTRILQTYEQAEPLVAKVAVQFIDKHRDEMDRQEQKFAEISKRVTDSIAKRHSLRKTDEDSL